MKFLEDIANECSGATMLAGLSVNGVAHSEDISNWIKIIGLKYNKKLEKR